MTQYLVGRTARSSVASSDGQEYTEHIRSSVSLDKTTTEKLGNLFDVLTTSGVALPPLLVPVVMARYIVRAGISEAMIEQLKGGNPPNEYKPLFAAIDEYNLPLAKTPHKFVLTWYDAFKTDDDTPPPVERLSLALLDHGDQVRCVRGAEYKEHTFANCDEAYRFALDQLSPLSGPTYKNCAHLPIYHLQVSQSLSSLQSCWSGPPKLQRCG
jgi:hypothetical protein